MTRSKPLGGNQRQLRTGEGGFGISPWVEAVTPPGALQQEKPHGGPATLESSLPEPLAGLGLGSPMLRPELC